MTERRRRLFLFKMLRDTHAFVMGQKVWAEWTTGACAAEARGRWKGRGRWVSSWVRWADADGGKAMSGLPTCEYVDRVEVGEDLWRKVVDERWTSDGADPCGP